MTTKELPLFVESQKLADDLDGDDFRVAESVGVGLRARRRPRSATWSSMRQKTVIMTVLRSTRAESSLLLA
jgi:hypothetical protein